MDRDPFFFVLGGGFVVPVGAIGAGVVAGKLVEGEVPADGVPEDLYRLVAFISPSLQLGRRLLHEAGFVDGFVYFQQVGERDLGSGSSAKQRGDV